MTHKSEQSSKKSMSHKSEQNIVKPLLRYYFALIVFTVMCVVGCTATICQNCINRVPDAPIFTHFEPLPSAPSRVAPIPNGVYYKVLCVIDGDTLIILDDDGTEFRVRLIGIDSPEIRPMQPFGQEAKHRVEELIEAANGYVRLLYDEDGTDRNGRIRAHVYLAIDDTEVWLNHELVLRGYAISVLAFRQSDSSKKALVEAEIDARRHRRGMWSLPNPPFL